MCLRLTENARKLEINRLLELCVRPRYQRGFAIDACGAWNSR